MRERERFVTPLLRQGLGLVLIFAAYSAGGETCGEQVRWRALKEVAQPLVREAPARVEPLEQTVVAAEVAGRIAALPVRVGEAVAAGTAVAELDRSFLLLRRNEAQAALTLAQTRQAQAKRLLEQAERLLAKQAGNREAVISAEEAVRLAEAEVALRAAQLAQAEWRLARATVRSPLAGIVTARLASEGSWVAVGQGIVAITPQTVEVAARLVGGQAEELRRPGAEPRFVALEAGDGQRLTVPLALEAVNGQRDPSAQLVTVRLRVISSAFSLPPGSVGLLRWQAPLRVVPPEAVTTLEGKVGVWLRSGKDAAPKFVPLPFTAAGRAAAVPLPEEASEQAEIAVGGQGWLAWQQAAGKACAP
jgi:RND family efflux transporter MFP subunit